MQRTPRQQPPPETSRDLGEFWDRRVQEELSRSEYHPEKRLYIMEVQRAIDRALPRVRTILDVGGGYGEFSIGLAERGYRVVHIDPSPRMLETARQIADARGVPRENLVLSDGDVRDLSRFADGQFDLVLCLDAPVSFVAREFEHAIDEVTRVAASKVMVSVLNRTGLVPIWLADEVRRAGSLSGVRRLYETGDWEPGHAADDDPSRSTGEWFPAAHFFQPRELAALLSERGFTVVDHVAPGSLSRLVPAEALAEIVADAELTQEYLALAERYNRDSGILGVGGLQAAGLLVIAERGGSINR